MKKALFVTIMGITNIGKTTQMLLLEKLLKEKGLKYFTLKYPIYDLEPTGPRIHRYLKAKNPENLTPAIFQSLCASNRRDFEPRLESIFTENDIVIGEMYTGTGIAYGMCDGVPKEYLLEENEGLIILDVSILLDGERFMESVEDVHHFENDKEKTDFARQVHLELAKDLNWLVINANQTIEEVHKQIVDEIFRHIKIVEQ